MRTFLLSLATPIVLSALAFADPPASIKLDHNSVAAVAYSPTTGKFGYACNYRSRSEAEKNAVGDCGAADARVVGWVKYGFFVLALGDDKTCWGVGWQYGPDSGTEAPRKAALDNCAKCTTGAHEVLVLSSDGQRISDSRKTVITITDASGNVTVVDGSGKVISTSPAPTSPSQKTVPSKSGDGSMFDTLLKARDGENKKGDSPAPH